MMTMLVSAALLAASLAAPATSDASPFYRTYAKGTVDAAARAAERSAAKEESATHRDCGNCGCHKSQADKGSPERK